MAGRPIILIIIGIGNAFCFWLWDVVFFKINSWVLRFYPLNYFGYYLITVSAAINISPQRLI
ncbi:hypothetical protein SAMN05216404_11930 [Nitrosospira multiformis]|uniref:Uncharacterized protein n=1 Tax=Nitrosospira multiformis TaxID=1231 RepID=A0A1H8P6K2_9PROT|nr:hypothetical protein SAMN05216404_11930 [Nitrosospira multiformis]